MPCRPYLEGEGSWGTSIAKEGRHLFGFGIKVKTEGVPTNT